MRHAKENGLMGKRKLGESHAAKLVLDTQTGIFYDCAKEAALARGIIYTGHFRSQLCGHRKNKTGIVYV
jgi:hypothetical protein